MLSAHVGVANRVISESPRGGLWFWGGATALTPMALQLESGVAYCVLRCESVVAKLSVRRVCCPQHGVHDEEGDRHPHLHSSASPRPCGSGMVTTIRGHMWVSATKPRRVFRRHTITPRLQGVIFYPWTRDRLRARDARVAVGESEACEQRDRPGWRPGSQGGVQCAQTHAVFCRGRGAVALFFAKSGTRSDIRDTTTARCNPATCNRIWGGGGKSLRCLRV